MIRFLRILIRVTTQVGPVHSPRVRVECCVTLSRTIRLCYATTILLCGRCGIFFFILCWLRLYEFPLSSQVRVLLRRDVRNKRRSQKMNLRRKISQRTQPNPHSFKFCALFGKSVAFSRVTEESIRFILTRELHNGTGAVYS